MFNIARFFEKQAERDALEFIHIYQEASREVALIIREASSETGEEERLED
ncbi:hypothetical protein [Nocardiopsis sp. ATB16-24]|nr:hypothetical protein [Nocardiopsis sp. ATB16-24]